MHPFSHLESEVRGYIRDFPALFATAKGHQLFTAAGESYLDFFAGAGAMNYGHNPAPLKAALLDYLIKDGVIHSLDLATVAKAEFLEAFEARILRPRNLEYKLQFPGPTGTNAVEAALKLARKVTGRTSVVCFTNGFHGMTLGALAVTGNAFKRRGAGLPLQSATSMPFAGYLEEEADTIRLLERFLADRSSGLDLPAAFIVETIQAEGGVNVASTRWLQRLAQLATEYGVLLVIDDIQVGCGRTGPFFSFEEAGITPDLICLSKALSGYGLPLALTLIKPEHDQWEPGEHNGTFRGHNPAFVTAKVVLDEYWATSVLADSVAEAGALVSASLNECVGEWPEAISEVRGRGLIQGLQFTTEGMARQVSQECFQRNLLIETAGPTGNVLKLLPPLTTPRAALEEGLGIIRESIEVALQSTPRSASVPIPAGIGA